MKKTMDPLTREIFDYLDSWRPSRTKFYRSPAQHMRVIQDRWVLTPDDARMYMAAYVVYTVLGEDFSQV